MEVEHSTMLLLGLWRKLIHSCHRPGFCGIVPQIGVLSCSPGKEEECPANFSISARSLVRSCIACAALTGAAPFRFNKAWSARHTYYIACAILLTRQYIFHITEYVFHTNQLVILYAMLMWYMHDGCPAILLKMLQKLLSCPAKWNFQVGKYADGILVAWQHELIAFWLYNNGQRVKLIH